MELMTLDDFKNTTEAKTVDSPQYLCLPANLHKLHQVMPLPPEIDDDTFSEPTPMHRWFGRVASQSVIIECEANFQNPIGSGDSVIVVTPPIDGPEWAVILRLHALPSFIFPSRPNRICSRNDKAEAVVYRPNQQGWEDEVYCAASRKEAEDLLAFLLLDDFNRDCYVGDFEPPGEWQAMTEGGKRVLACYPEKNLTLKVACKMSLRDRIDIVVVNVAEHSNGREYRVRNGSVGH